MQERVPRINIESDEEISREFCYFIDDKETGNQHIIIYLCTAHSAFVVFRSLSYVHLNTTFAISNPKSKQGYLFLDKALAIFQCKKHEKRLKGF